MVKILPANAGDTDLIPVLKRSLEKEPALIFLPGKSHGQRSLLGYSPRGRKRIRHNLATKQVSLYNSYLEIIQFASKGHMGEKLFSDCYL